MVIPEKPTIVVVAAISQTLIALAVFAVWATAALWGASLLGSLLSATLFFGVPLCLSVAAAWGLWRGNRLGWHLSLLADSVALILLVIPGLVQPLTLRVVLGVILILTLVLLSLRDIRSTYRQSL